MTPLQTKIEEIKARYPETCNIEGLEPAFTSDLMEIAQWAVETVKIDKLNADKFIKIENNAFYARGFNLAVDIMKSNAINAGIIAE